MNNPYDEQTSIERFKQIRKRLDYIDRDVHHDNRYLYVNLLHTERMNKTMGWQPRAPKPVKVEPVVPELSPEDQMTKNINSLRVVRIGGFVSAVIYTIMVILIL